MEWASSLEPESGVGSKHHTVPVVYLRNCGDERASASQPT